MLCPACSHRLSYHSPSGSLAAATPAPTRSTRLSWTRPQLQKARSAPSPGWFTRSCKLINGKEFGYTATYRDPRKISLAKAIPGWVEGLQMMKDGGKAKLVAPPHLGYGRKGKRTSIPGCAVLIFEIRCSSIQSQL